MMEELKKIGIFLKSNDNDGVDINVSNEIDLDEDVRTVLNSLINNGDNGDKINLMSVDEFVDTFTENMVIEDENFILTYYELIRKGEITVSKKVKKMVYKVYSDYIYSLTHLDSKYFYDKNLGLKPINFIQNIPNNFTEHSDNKKKVKLGLYQKFIISVFYGFVERKTGRRKYNTLYMEIARKNGKTFLSALLYIYNAVMEQEQAPQYVSVASSYQQANILFNMAYNVIKDSPELEPYFKGTNTKLIKTLHNYGTMKALTGESKGLDGLEVQGAHIDELHAIEDMNLLNVVIDSQIRKPNHYQIITTTSPTFNSEVYNTKYREFSDILDSFNNNEVISEHTLIMIYELDDENEWRNSDNWEKANPGLRDGVKPFDSLKRVMDSCIINDNDDELIKVDKGYKLKNMLIKHFNVVQNSKYSWLDYSDFSYDKTFDDSIFNYISYVDVGLDLSLSDDLTALIIVFKVDGYEDFFVKPMFFMLEKEIPNKIKENSFYDIYVKDGYIKALKGDVINPIEVIDWLITFLTNYGVNIHNFSVDNAYLSDEVYSYILNNLLGNEPERLKKVPQTKKVLNKSMRFTESLFKGKKINYQKNPVMQWNINNVILDIDFNKDETLIKPYKEVNKNKIDGVDALLNTFDTYLSNINLMNNVVYNRNKVEDINEFINYNLDKNNGVD